MYQDWIKEIDINIDYFSAFIKAWIGFNSWYRSKYTERQDKQIIDKIKLGNNEFKNYIRSLINNDTIESEEFKQNIGRLHKALITATIMTQERTSTAETISFSNIAITNIKNICDEYYRASRYMLKRTNDNIEIQVINKNNGDTLFYMKQSRYNEVELESNVDFKNLSYERQAQVKAFYKEINPYITESVIKRNPTENDANIYSDIHFIDNDEKIAIAIIDVLYLLRCSLMHGEVCPNRNTMQVYKYAYEILSVILKKML